MGLRRPGFGDLLLQLQSRQLEPRRHGIRDVRAHVCREVLYLTF